MTTTHVGTVAEAHLLNRIADATRNIAEASSKLTRYSAEVAQRIAANHQFDPRFAATAAATLAEQYGLRAALLEVANSLTSAERLEAALTTSTFFVPPPLGATDPF